MNLSMTATVNPKLAIGRIVFGMVQIVSLFTLFDDVSYSKTLRLLLDIIAVANFDSEVGHFESNHSAFTFEHF